MEDRLPLVQAKQDQRPHLGNTRTRRFPQVPEQYPAQTDNACKERGKDHKTCETLSRPGTNTEPEYNSSTHHDKHQIL